MQLIDEVNNARNRNGGYEEEIYYRCISRSREKTETDEDKDAYIQNRIIMNNFVSGSYESNRRPSIASFPELEEAAADDKMLSKVPFEVYRKSPLFPKLL